MVAEAEAATTALAIGEWGRVLGRGGKRVEEGGRGRGEGGGQVPEVTAELAVAAEAVTTALATAGWGAEGWGPGGESR